MFDFIIKFIINNKSESLKESLNYEFLELVKSMKDFQYLVNFCDLFKVVGVIKIDKIKFIIVIIIEIKINLLF